MVRFNDAAQMQIGLQMRDEDRLDDAVNDSKKRSGFRRRIKGA